MCTYIFILIFLCIHIQISYIYTHAHTIRTYVFIYSSSLYMYVYTALLYIRMYIQLLSIHVCIYSYTLRHLIFLKIPPATLVITHHRSLLLVSFAPLLVSFVPEDLQQQQRPRSWDLILDSSIYRALLTLLRTTDNGLWVGCVSKGCSVGLFLGLFWHSKSLLTLGCVSKRYSVGLFLDLFLHLCVTC